jgi:phage replication O-like protein O
VKADIEDGYDRLAHTLTNALAQNQAKLSGCEFQLVFAIISKTYRFHKKADWIASTQLCELTGMSKAHLSKTLKALIDKNVVLKNGKNVGINSVVSEWKVNQSVNNKKLTNQLSKVNQSVKGANQSVNKSCPIRPPQKKETITKEINTKEKTNVHDLKSFDLPSFIPKKIINEFIQHRKQIKKPMTELALDKFIKKLSREYEQGYCLERIIDNAIANGWQTTYPRKEDKVNSSPAYSDVTARNLQMLDNMEFN